MPWVTAAAPSYCWPLSAIYQATRTRARPGAALARWDLDQDGRLDILDAFTLARELKQGGTRNVQWDVDGMAKWMSATWRPLPRAP